MGTRRVREQVVQSLKLYIFMKNEGKGSSFLHKERGLATQSDGGGALGTSQTKEVENERTRKMVFLKNKQFLLITC